MEGKKNEEERLTQFLDFIQERDGWQRTSLTPAAIVSKHREVHLGQNQVLTILRGERRKHDVLYGGTVEFPRDGCVWGWVAGEGDWTLVLLRQHNYEGRQSCSAQL